MKIYNQIIEGINGVLKETIHSYVNGDTSTINLFGLANIYRVENDKTAPMVNNNGELQYLWNLDYPVLGYHRLTSTDFKPKTGFGSTEILSGASAISFIVVGKRETLNTEPETLALAISSQLLDTAIDAKPLSVNISLNGFKSEPNDIIKVEMSSKDYADKYNNPDYFFLKINYSLLIEFKANCLTCK